MLALAADVQLDELVEEVAGSVYTGYSFQRKSIAQLMGERQLDGDRSNEHLDSISALEAFGHDMDDAGRLCRRRGGVLCYIDIDPTALWDFHVQPGAIRRIVMNLLGNSLKFTKKGYIWISLRQARAPTREAPQIPKVILTISDSGKGISEDFLRNSLFSPFSQEDNLTQGTGLGLSLVRQIAATLGGYVTFTSQSGRGTTAQVTLPMMRTRQAIAKDRDFSGYLEELRGLSISLRGFTQRYERVIEETAEHPSSVSEAAVMEMLCRDWIGMRVLPLKGIEEEPPDLILCSESAFVSLEDQDPIVRLSLPTVVVCHDAYTVHDFAKSSRKAWNTEFISQP